jgi:transcriptional regulator GlxA family with amidase domain
MSKRIGLLLFDDVDLLDVGGPYEVFLTAGRLRVRARHPNPFEVITIGVTGDAVTAYGGIRLAPTHTIDEAGHLNLVVIPGAIAIDEVAGRREVMAAVERLIRDAGTVASVCTGAFLLGDVGLLDDVPWTTHWEDLTALSERIGSDLGTRAAWIDAGRVVTGGGLSNGIAMALHLVERLEDRALAEATARQIDFQWS